MTKGVIMKVHYIMPMAGRGSRFHREGYDFPKPLIKIYGKPFFYWATESIAKYVDVRDITFIVLKIKSQSSYSIIMI